MELLTGFKTYLETLKNGPSAVSIKNYVADVRKFVRWFESAKQITFHPNLVTTATLEEYKSSLLSSLNPDSGEVAASQNDNSQLNAISSSKSVERYFSSLRKFWAWIEAENVSSTNPFQMLNENEASKSEADSYFLRNFKNSLFESKSSDLTVKNYLLDVKQFLNWAALVTDQTESYIVNQTGLLSRISTDLIEEYKNRLLYEARLSPASINRKLSSLRKYLAFLLNQGLIESAPFVVNTSEKHLGVQPITEINTKKSAFADFGDSTGVGSESGLSPEGSLIQNEKNVKSNVEVTGFAPAESWMISQIPHSSTPTPLPSVAEEIQPRQYSRFGPARFFQKIGRAGNWMFDLLFILPLVKLIENGHYHFLRLSGKSLFQAAHAQSLPARLLSKLPLGALIKAGLKLDDALSGRASKSQVPGLSHFIQNKQPISNSGFLPRRQAGRISNFPKEFYAPHKISLDSLPLHKKALHHLRHTRPNWYRKYHSYAITHYFHFALLMIVITALGVGMYNAFFESPNKGKPALAALPTAPPRILSFQGRLTDNSDNPITAVKQVRFSIYASPTATGSGNLLWQELQSVAPDNDGIFSVYMGNTTTVCADPLSPATTQCVIPSTLFSQNASLYLGITIQNDSELTPRQQLATVAYAANSETLQGLPPITAGGAGQTNVVLALDSAGNLNIGGTAAPTFQASGGQFTLSGTVLNLTTTAGSNSNIQLVPDGLGKIDMQKALVNSSLNGPLTTAAGALQIDDLFAVNATSSGQSAFTLNQDGTGPLLSASTSGVAKFTVSNAGDLILAGNLTSNGTGSNYFGGNVGIGTTAPLAKLDVNGTASVSGNLTLAGGARSIVGSAMNTLTIGDASTGNIQLAAGSATPAFILTTAGQVGIGTISPGATLDITGTLRNSGAVTFSTFTSNGGPLYTNGSGVLAQTTAGTSSQCLIGGTTPSFSDCAGAAASAIYWNQASGALFPKNSTVDLLIGGQATSSAKFAVLGLNTTQSTASVSGQFIVMPTNGWGGNVGIGTIAPTQKLDIVGNVNLSTGSTYKINGADVLTASTLGTSVLTSSLTSVGALASGSIASGFGTIATANTITGTILNGTTGINTGASVGTQRIDTSGNLVNIGTTQFNTQTYTWPASQVVSGFLQTNGTGGLTWTTSIAANALAWSSLTNPTANLALSMAAYTSTFTYNAATGVSNLFNLTDTTSNTGTGYLLNLTTATGSTLKPFHVSAAGVEALMVNASGNVGIGTVTPSSALHVDVTQAGVFASQIKNESGTGSGLYIFANSNGTADILNTQGWTGSAVTLGLNVKSNGNVGIGTTAPGANLTVAGSGGVFGTNTKDLFQLVNTDTTATNNAANMSFFANRTGGQSTPLASISAIMTNNGSTTYTGALAFSTAGTAAVPTERLRIDGAGNVGIGTNNPQAPLQIDNAGYTLRITPGATSQINTDDWGSSISFRTTQSGGTINSNILYLASTGNVGIGTSAPSSLLQVQGTTPSLILNNTTTNSANSGTIDFLEDVNLFGTTNGFGMRMTYDGSANQFSIQSGVGTTVNTRLVINRTDGNVGIGTTTPTALLDVAGTASISSSLSFRTGAGSIQTTAFNTLTLGGATTGNILVNPRNSASGGYFAPVTDNVTDLGASPSARFKSLYLGPGSLHIQCTTGDGCGQGLDYAMGVNTSTGTFSVGVNGATSTGNPLLNITQGGNIGIGTITPGAKLAVNGDTQSSRFVDYENTAYYLDPANATTSLLVNGNVGIGTTAPGFMLDIRNGSGLAVGGQAGYQGTITNALSSPFAITTLTAQGGTGTWQGQMNFNLSYNGGAAYTLMTLKDNLGSGNVGIGTTAPGGLLHVYDASNTFTGTRLLVDGSFTNPPASSKDVYFRANLDNNANHVLLYLEHNNVAGQLPNGHLMQAWADGGSSAAIAFDITAAGSVGIGTTAPNAKLHVKGGTLLVSGNAARTTVGGYTSAVDVGYAGGGLEYGIDMLPEADGANSISFFNAAGSNIGSISNSSSGTAYNTTSDQRLKYNITNTSLGLDTLMKVKPRDFVFKTDPSKTIQQGFIAQELYNVYPEAVRVGGENPQLNPWGVDYGRLTPLIIKSVQELNSKIASNFALLANLSLTSGGDLTLEPDPAAEISALGGTGVTGNVKYNVRKADETFITQIAGLAEAVIGNLRAGAIQAMQISTNSLAISTNNITIAGMSLKDYIVQVVREAGIRNQESSFISPIARVDQLYAGIISPLASDSAVVVNGKVIIKGDSSTSSQNDKLALEVQGSASISGQLNATDASVSGTLRAGRIIASDIEGLTARIATLSAQTIINNTNVYNNTSNVAAAASDSGQIKPAFRGAVPSLLSSNILTDYASIASLSAQFASIANLSADFGQFSQGLMALGPSSLSDTSITGQLSLGGGMILSENSVNVLGADLALQPLKQGGVSIMGGLVAINTDGDLTVGGNAVFAKNVLVKGTLAVNFISPIPNEDLVIKLGNQESGSMNQGRDSRFIIRNSSSSAVLAVNQAGDVTASGSGLFKDLAANAFNIVRGAQADTSITETVASSSAGTGIINAAQTERTIVSPFVTEKSLIYITPTSDTGGQMPYVARQVAHSAGTQSLPAGRQGSFTVQVPLPPFKDIKFNWWIVN